MDGGRTDGRRRTDGEPRTDSARTTDGQAGERSDEGASVQADGRMDRLTVKWADRPTVGGRRADGRRTAHGWQTADGVVPAAFTFELTSISEHHSYGNFQLFFFMLNCSLSFSERIMSLF